MRRNILVVLLASLAAGLVATIVSAESAKSAQGAQPVSEQNVDSTGLIRVHEQGVVRARAVQDGAWNVGLTGTPTVKVDAAEPLAVRAVNDIQPFARTFSMSAAVGDQLAFADPFQVPVGKRLVIQHLTYFASVDDDDLVGSFELLLDVMPGEPVTFFTFRPGERIDPGSPIVSYVGGENVQNLYVRGGGFMTARFSRQQLSTPASGNLSISGYLESS
jgi:hypothetical protein